MKSTDGRQSPTTKDERHNSTMLSFWNWKVFGGQNKKKELKCYVKKCVVSTCGVAKIGQPRKNKKTKLDSSE